MEKKQEWVLRAEMAGSFLAAILSSGVKVRSLKEDFEVYLCNFADKIIAESKRRERKTEEG